MLLELFIKREHVTFLLLVASIDSDSTFCVFTHSFLKEVWFALEGDGILSIHGKGLITL
jgi:hypothetical protein